MRHAPPRQTLDRQPQYDQDQHQPDTNQAPPSGPVMVPLQVETTAPIKDSRHACQNPGCALRRAKSVVCYSAASISADPASASCGTSD